MRVLVTRPEKEIPEFAKALQGIGAEAIYFPTIDIAPVGNTSILDHAFSRLSCYDWLVLTSANAADVFLERKAVLGIDGISANTRIAAIGARTAARLQDQGITPDFVPQEYVAEAILPGLGELGGKWILIPAADIAHDTLPQAIREADGIAHVITAYHTVPAKPNTEGLAALRGGLDWITFSSGSTARNFVTLLRGAGLDPFNLPGDPKIACIGPKTARAAQELGFPVAAVAETYSVEGLVHVIETHPRGRGQR